MKFHIVALVLALVGVAFVGLLFGIPAASAHVGTQPQLVVAGFSDHSNDLIANVSFYVNRTAPVDFLYVAVEGPCLGTVKIRNLTNYRALTHAGCGSSVESFVPNIWYYKGTLSSDYNHIYWSYSNNEYVIVYAAMFAQVDPASTPMWDYKSNNTVTNRSSFGMFLPVPIGQNSIAVMALGIEYDSTPPDKPISGVDGGASQYSLFGIQVNDTKYAPIYLPCYGRQFFGAQYCFAAGIVGPPSSIGGFTFALNPTSRILINTLIVTGYPYVAPTVSTAAASNILSTSAVLHGHLDDLGSEASVTVGFKYSNDSGFVFGVVNVSVGSLSSTVNFVRTVGLQPNTTYYFRAWAYSIAGFALGSTLNLTTQVRDLGIVDVGVNAFWILLFLIICGFMVGAAWVIRRRYL